MRHDRAKGPANFLGLILYVCSLYLAMLPIIFLTVGGLSQTSYYVSKAWKYCVVFLLVAVVCGCCGWRIRRDRRR